MIWKCISVEPSTEFGMQIIVFTNNDVKGKITIEVGVSPELNYKVGKCYKFPTALDYTCEGE